MRIETIALGFGLALAIGTPACGGILLEKTEGGVDAGVDAQMDAGMDAPKDAPGPCRGLGETACRGRTDCAVGACALCGGGSTFIACYDPAREPGPVCVLGPCPISCVGLDEASCKTWLDCRVDTCPSCNGGSGFVRCAAPNDPPALCPAIACPAPCTNLTAKDECEARPDCHSVFVDGRTCGCAALGCCARFSRCAEGATAVCKAPAITCDAVTPYCEGPYVVSYAGSCYEGCVLSTDCALNW